MSDGPDAASAWAALLRAHAAVVPKLGRELLAAGMPIAWYDVLLVVNAAPGRRLRMSEVGQQAVLSRERVSRVVQELEQAGLVERQPNPEDRRSWFASITTEGRRRLRGAAPAYLRGIDAHFGRHLSAQELEVLADALRRVVSAEESSEPPPARGR